MLLHLISIKKESTINHSKDNWRPTLKKKNNISGRLSLVFVILIVVISSLACNLSVEMADKPTSVPEEVIPTSPPQPLPPTDLPPTLQPPAANPTSKAKASPAATNTEQPAVQIQEPTQTLKPSATARPEGITVTAATGNLFIRRGPGSTYNIVSGLTKGTTTKALGRNEKNDWLAIEIPNANGTTGWISMGTIFTQLNGSMQDLPLFKYDEAKPAYLRNCTLHDMTTKPGQWNLPAKTTQKVNPGEFKILDMSTGQSEVKEVDLKEGNTIYIKVDGNGISYGC
jgi:uncharacterized protein YgiM (DUF1202 family)